MKKNPWLVLVGLLFLFGTMTVVFISTSISNVFSEAEPKVSKNSILMLDLEGIIFDSKKFLKQLKKYRKDDRIKAIVLNVNSPGGVVGPSQEIYEEIKRSRTVFNKPVVAVSTNLAASGAYYASVAADKIIVAPGTLIGSIGVIMEFANLEKLYDWAKIQRYTITTGKYKDSGAEYRGMRDDEKELFQNLANEVWGQFKEAVAEGRNLKLDFVNGYADGRVLNGANAVKLGFADALGTTEDAIKMAAEMAKLGDNYELFEIPKHKPGIMDLLAGPQDEDFEGKFDKVLGKVFKTKLLNKPLFLMPGTWE